ncbi:MAG TPA: hypothetical protein VF173_07370 [Thermoanaerobaculia bacterium]|nr:hypothetical protein [Thermoanaerobaculia bacterium]
MRKKLMLLTVALGFSAAASLSAIRPPVGIHCTTTCCEDRPTLCFTCCPGHICPDIACP